MHARWLKQISIYLLYKMYGHFYSFAAPTSAFSKFIGKFSSDFLHFIVLQTRKVTRSWRRRLAVHFTSSFETLASLANIWVAWLMYWRKFEKICKHVYCMWNWCFANTNHFVGDCSPAGECDWMSDDVKF